MCQPLFLKFFQEFFKIARERWNFNEKNFYAEALGAPSAGETGKISRYIRKTPDPTALYMEGVQPTRTDLDSHQTRPDRSRRAERGRKRIEPRAPPSHIEEESRPNTRAVRYPRPERKPRSHSYQSGRDPRRVDGGEREKRP